MIATFKQKTKKKKKMTEASASVCLLLATAFVLFLFLSSLETTRPSIAREVDHGKEKSRVRPPILSRLS